MESSLPTGEGIWNQFSNSFNFSLPTTVAISSQQSALTLPTQPALESRFSAKFRHEYRKFNYIYYSDAVVNDVQIELENSSMWSKFHQFGTEMIITKTGRYAYSYHYTFAYCI